MLVPTNQHRVFRERFYRAVASAIGSTVRAVQEMPEIHAKDLLRGFDDEVKLQFLTELVALCVDLKFRIYRVGYYEDPEVLSVFKHRKALLALSFVGLLHCLEDELSQSEIWPVVETDFSAEQVRHFPGVIQNLDYLTAILGKSFVTIDNRNLGEVLYSTKRSAYGATVDCIAYLLDAKFRGWSGGIASPFKQQLIDIAERLDSIIEFNEIIALKLEAAPPGYVGKGPFRYARRMLPSG